ncbi:MAG TPA: hypothetical protein VFK31_02595 [Rhodanobacteraceae bacterium]|nr:hypothetical protein [Rhodanobacteraceae bacterium]
MTFKIAIQPDEVVHHNGEYQSFSRRWSELAQRHHIDVVPVDVFSPDIISRIAVCDAFMWRCDPSAHPRLYAKRLLYAIEAGMDMPVFPSLRSSWHFEDKIGQYYFLAAAGVPTPATHVLWNRAQAEQFCHTATYPFVLKLAIGYQSANVQLVRNRSDALFYVDQMFGGGLVSLGYRPAPRPRLMLRRLRAAAQVAEGHHPNGPTDAAELQHGYFFAQEFLPGNEYDVRVTIIGNRAFAFRRFNRPGDFRASGSGRIDWDPAPIEEDAIRLAYQVAHGTNAQTVAVDILRRGTQPVVVELTLSYASWAVRDCPGHWVLHGEPRLGKLEWVEGSMRPEDAIFADFVPRIPHAELAIA